MAGYSDYIINMAAKVISNAVPYNDINMIINTFKKDSNDDFKSSHLHIFESSVDNILGESRNSGSAYSKRNEDFLEIEIERCIKNTLSYLKSENYIEGEVTKTQIYLEALVLRDKSLFLEVFQRVWLAVYYTPEHLRDYLCIAASMDYELMKDRADVLILGCSGHEDSLVQEAAIRAFESWGNPEHATHLRSMRRFDEKWIEDYKQSTILFLESLK